MTELVLLVLGPVIVGVILAAGWWLAWGRKTGLPDGKAVALSLVAGLMLLIGTAAVRLVGAPMLLPFDVSSGVVDWWADYRFTAPMLTGILGMLLLAFPVRARSGLGTAELMPRTPVSFARGWWFTLPAVVLALILTITMLAGFASQPDPTTGRYTMYFVDLGGERVMGTSIYGWFYSLPCLMLIGVMIVIALLVLFLIARPALDRDHERDVRVRAVRTRNVIAVGTGAFLVHLGQICGSVAGTASVRSWFPTSEGSVTFWTTFAATESALAVFAGIATAVGCACWASVALSAWSSRQRARVTVVP